MSLTYEELAGLWLAVLAELLSVLEVPHHIQAGEPLLMHQTDKSIMQHICKAEIEGNQLHSRLP